MSALVKKKSINSSKTELKKLFRIISRQEVLRPLYSNHTPLTGNQMREKVKSIEAECHTSERKIICFVKTKKNKKLLNFQCYQTLKFQKIREHGLSVDCIIVSYKNK